jgi:hypothetical protein
VVTGTPTERCGSWSCAAWLQNRCDDPRARRATHSAGAEQTRDRALLEALRRPPDLSRGASAQLNCNAGTRSHAADAQRRVWTFLTPPLAVDHPPAVPELRLAMQVIDCHVVASFDRARNLTTPLRRSSATPRLASREPGDGAIASKVTVASDFAGTDVDNGAPGAAIGEELVPIG